MFIAFGLFDRYMFKVFKGEFAKSIDIILLATACLFLAAKLNEPLNPLIIKMIQLLDEKYHSDPDTGRQLRDIEFDVVRTLEFEM